MPERARSLARRAGLGCWGKRTGLAGGACRRDGAFFRCRVSSRISLHKRVRARRARLARPHKPGSRTTGTTGGPRLDEPPDSPILPTTRMSRRGLSPVFPLWRGLLANVAGPDERSSSRRAPGAAVRAKAPGIRYEEANGMWLGPSRAPGDWGLNGALGTQPGSGARGRRSDEAVVGTSCPWALRRYGDGRGPSAPAGKGKEAGWRRVDQAEAWALAPTRERPYARIRGVARPRHGAARRRGDLERPSGWGAGAPDGGERLGPIRGARGPLWR
jgi:hypothetical protein